MALRQSSKAASQKKRAREERQESSASEVEDVGRGSTSQNTHEEDILKLSHKLVRLAISNEYTRKPLKRETINKLVLGDQSRLIKTVIDMANNHLRKVFGMELVQLRSRAAREFDSQQQQETGSSSAAATKKKNFPASNMWILRSTIKNVYLDQLDDIVPELESDSEKDGGPTNREAMEWRQWTKDEGSGIHSKSNDQRALLGILHVILSLILLNGRVMSETELYRHLKRLGLQENTVLPLDISAPRRDGLTLGMYLSQLQRQQYLERKIPAIAQRTQKSQATSSAANNEDPLSAVEWRWGPRADMEIGEKLLSRKFISEFVIPPRPNGQAPEQGAIDETMENISKAAGSELVDARQLGK